MAPKGTTTSVRGRSEGSKTKSTRAVPPASSNPFASSDDDDDQDDHSVVSEEELAAARSAARGGKKKAAADDDAAGGAAEEAEQPEKTIPRDLLTRLLHEFFAKEATRISKDANAAAGKYIDVFVREAIARTAVEKQGGFLEVEDLEKISPQLLLDL